MLFRSLIEFGRAFWKALEPQKPTDWVDVQSFIWSVCPGTYQGRTEAGSENGKHTLQEAPPQDVHRRYWTIAPGRDGEHWTEFYSEGIIAIGWDEVSDLQSFKGQEEIRERLLQLQPEETSKKHDSLALWQFAHEMQRGDIVFAKEGFAKLLGYGIVVGDYVFATERPAYKHVRKVNWLRKGEWEMPEHSRMAPKTLTDITSRQGVVKLIASRVGLEMPVEPSSVVVALPPSTGVAYWWLNANPKIWNFEEPPVGEKQSYTSHN